MRLSVTPKSTGMQQQVIRLINRKRLLQFYTYHCFGKGVFMTQLKVALIGFGSFARKAYLPALEYDGRAIVTSVAAPSEKTRQDVNQNIRTQCMYFGKLY